jgi:hypothetical protein
MAFAFALIDESRQSWIRRVTSQKIPQIELTRSIVEIDIDGQRDTVYAHHK